MKKRALSGILWFLTGWYAGAFVAFLFGLSPALGPILGTAAAAIVAVDPRQIIWTPSAALSAPARTGQTVSNPA